VAAIAWPRGWGRSLLLLAAAIAVAVAVAVTQYSTLFPRTLGLGCCDDLKSTRINLHNRGLEQYKMQLDGWLITKLTPSINPCPIVIVPH